MFSRRPAILLVAVIALTVTAACGQLLNGNPSSPSGADTSVMFLGDPDARFNGVHPAPVAVNGVIYVYINTANDGVTVQKSTDGLTFSPTPASYPAGVTRTIVSLPDGRFRMYYAPDVNSAEIRSAVSSNGLNWTVESGTRYTEPNPAGVRAAALPGGGYRLYHGTVGGTINSAISSDGLSFTAEGPIALPAPDGTFTWSASAVAYLGNRYHIILTKQPSSGASEFWHGVSSDGRNWTVDSSVLAVNPGTPLNQPAWCITSTLRVYYRAQYQGSNAIASGIIKF